MDNGQSKLLLVPKDSYRKRQHKLITKELISSFQHYDVPLRARLEYVLPRLQRFPMASFKPNCYRIF